ncbi:hypothetical protein AB0T83_18835 [Fluviibacterium sp. DFM31]|uniref:Winged helix domain-containing protein n=1 Tax=Meridianimarinicoccus marinus TaxID=3231483 RepID=A0ABV3LBL2_9RHOB
MAAKNNPGALAGATGAGKPVHARAEGTRRIARKSRGGTAYRVTTSAGDAFNIVVSGRDRWALEELRREGKKGCTPIDNPAPRWSGYVFNLRELGVEIETITETHEGDFPGHHARYVLRSVVAPKWKGGTA